MQKRLEWGIRIFPNFPYMKNIFRLRLVVCLALGLVFWLLCTYLASSNNPGIWGTPLMWTLIANRVTIGFVIAIIGVFTHHPCFGFRLYPILRGALWWAIISVQLAIGIYMTPNMPASQQALLFWMTILVGAVYGLIIDLVATKLSSEGKKLLIKWNL